MITELMASYGKKILAQRPPDGRRYWAARFWDRDTAEQHQILGDTFRDQKAAIETFFDRYTADVETVGEFACGTGEFTRMATDRIDARSILALDISPDGLRIARGRVPEAHVTFLQADFWKTDDIGLFDLVVCVDAIHHLGDLRQVLTRLHSFVKPGGLFIGNVWTADNYHDFQRKRYGSMRHLVRTAGFLSTAVLVRVSGGRLRTGSYRTQLSTSAETIAALNDIFADVKDIAVQPYFTGFVCQA